MAQLPLPAAGDALVLPTIGSASRDHLHLVPTGATTSRRRLAFRDALRADPDLAARNVALKERLAERFPDDREAYAEAKRPFVDAVIAEFERAQ
jgi:GrpB-like predicted nucleotidyltransferase (UPF0157 family)